MTTPPSDQADELREIARKHWHTGHGGYGDPCFAFDRQELDMFLKEVATHINTEVNAALARAEAGMEINREFLSDVLAPKFVDAHGNIDFPKLIAETDRVIETARQAIRKERRG